MRTTLDQHIRDLLYYHECVVVPGFGAFLTRFFPAEIHSATSMFRPPSRRVAFNARISDNDGLLAKHVAQVEGVTYQKALQGIEISVCSWQRILRSGKKINLHGVGRLFIDEAGLLQFNPALDSNFYIQSYGLNIFRATPMEREKQIKRSVNRAIENRKVQGDKAGPNSSTEGGQKKNWVLWAAILGPVVALVLIGSYLYTQERETWNNAAGYVTGIFGGGEDKAAEEEESSLALDSLAADDKGSAQDSIGQAGFTGESDEDYRENEEYNRSLYNVKERPASQNRFESSEGDQVTSDLPAEAEETEKSPAKTRDRDFADKSSLDQPRFQVIVGSFSEEANAQSYMRALEARGYQPYLANSFGMYKRVALGRFESEAQAKEMLSKVREDVNFRAWLNEN